MIHLNFSDLWLALYGFLDLLIVIGLVCLVALGIMFHIRWSTNKSRQGPIPSVPFGKTADTMEIERWLDDNTADSDGQRYKSTQEISEACKFTHQQVRRGCFYSPYIYQLDDDSKEMWTVYPDGSHKKNKY